MFYHVKELQFNARVSKPDPRFAGMLLEQFGGGNGELKAAMQYFVQSFAARKPYPEKYDLLMDIATEEFSHLEIVGATIQMLLDGVNATLTDADENALKQLLSKKDQREEWIHAIATNPQFFVLTGGGPALTNSQGQPWSGAYVNANGDLTVDLRSNIAAESRAKIVYEYLLQFTDDPLVHDTLRFLMTREIAHFQQFSAALATLEPNFPPGVRQGDPHFTHVAFNMSNGNSFRGPWNQGQGPWGEGEEWWYVDDPIQHVLESQGMLEHGIKGTDRTPEEVEKMNRRLSEQRSEHIRESTGKYPMQWSDYEKAEAAGAKR
jgi:Mn-containing catalase